MVLVYGFVCPCNKFMPSYAPLRPSTSFNDSVKQKMEGGG